MTLSIKCISVGPYGGEENEVTPGTEYSFWRVVEHTGAGWFPWSEYYATEYNAEEARLAALAKIREPVFHFEGWEVHHYVDGCEEYIACRGADVLRVPDRDAMKAAIRAYGPEPA